MKQEIHQLVDELTALPANWHQAGTVSREVLRAIAMHCERLGPLKHSAETGAGLTTLLLSHLSEQHTVFATDDGGSIRQTKGSSLLRADRVTFVEGPTQQTLPAYRFDCTFQFVLIDGPHGYPFPDLEYYYFYPRLEPGGLLVLDDTRIPTIGRMLEILRADAMFEFVELVRDTAFLKRTDAPAVDPLGDAWWLQGYNRAYHDELSASASQTPLGRALRRFSARSPLVLRDLVPESVKRMLRKVR